MDRVATWPEEWDEPRLATGIKNRIARLRCLGNAIVPQIAELFFRAMIEAENIT